MLGATMRGAALLAVTALLAAGCGGASPRAEGKPDSASAAVDAARGGSLTLLGGPRVSVPAGSVAGTGRLAGKVVNAPVSAPAGMRFAGRVYSLRVTGASLVGKVRLTFPVPRQAGSLAAPGAVLLAFYDTADGRWQPVPAVYSPAARTITATSGHLSIWTVLRLDTGRILAAAASALKGFIGIASTTSQPACPGAGRLAADGVRVASDKGGLVKWCAGVSGTSAPLLRVADNRSYALELTYPADWSVQRLGPPDPVASQIVTSVSRILSPAPSGQASIIVPGGHTVQFTIPAGTSGEAHASPSSEAYLADAFLYGADTLAMTFDGIPGVPRPNPTRTAKAISLAFSAKDCFTQIDALAHGDASSAHAAGALFRSDVALAVGCLKDQWKIAYGISGETGAFAVSAALWLLDGVQLILHGMTAAIDGAIYWRSYRIALAQTQVVYLPCCGLPGPAQNPQAHQAEDYRPRTFSFDATGSQVLENATWQTWNSGEAVAVGMAAINSCQPACAGGHYNKAPATVTLSSPRRCGSFWFWSKAVWHFPGIVPPGEKQDDTEQVLFGC